MTGYTTYKKDFDQLAKAINFAGNTYMGSELLSTNNEQVASSGGEQQIWAMRRRKSKTPEFNS